MSKNKQTISKLDTAILLESAFNLKAILCEIDESGTLNKSDILYILTDGDPICECCGDSLTLEDVKEEYIVKLDKTIDKIINNLN